MSNPYPELEEFLLNYNTIIRKSQSIAIFVRGIEFQKAEILELDKLLAATEIERLKARGEENNLKANWVLCLQLVCEAVKCELQFLICLKEDNVDFAWQALIDAQRLIPLAMRNIPNGGNYLEGYSYRLHSYEKTLFPDMYFSSRGGVISNSRCSICASPLENCEHIQGYAYMGEICGEIINDIISIEEISLVKNPADKSCRMISYQENGKSYDAFTMRVIDPNISQ